MNYNFEKSIEAGNLHHAFIIEGPFNADKLGYGKSIAKKILCKRGYEDKCSKCFICKKIEDDNHMDVLVIEPGKDSGRKVKSIKNEQIERLQERLLKKPFEGDRNIAIISGADTITARGFNRLLKTIEEPPEGTVIMLLSENSMILPQTIRSRCIHVRMDYSEKNLFEKGKNEALDVIMLMIDGDYFYKSKQLVENFAKEREEAFILLDAMEIEYREILLGKNPDYKRFTKDYIFKAVEYIEETRREIQKNVNHLYALKKMILNIGG